MKLEEKDKKRLAYAAGAVLLALYFAGLSVLGVSVALPFAFLWLIYELRSIGSSLGKQREQIERIAAR